LFHHVDGNQTSRFSPTCTFGSNFIGTQLNSRTEDHLFLGILGFSLLKCCFKKSHEHFQTLPNKPPQHNLSMDTFLINTAGKVSSNAAQVT
jgi:hypothetical protein